MSEIEDLEAGIIKIKEGCIQRRKVVGCLACGLPTFIGLIIFLCSIVSLGPEEQLVIVTKGGTGKEVVDGPSTFFCSPFKTTEKRTASRLSPQQYAKVKNARTGVRRHVEGPLLLFLGPWEELESVEPKIVLQAREYTRLVDSFTGLVRVEEGPQRLVPGPFESAPKGIQRATLVRNEESALVLDSMSGRKRIVQDEGFFTPGPFEEVLEVRRATLLKQTEYAIVKNTFNGTFRHEEGAKLLFIGPYDEVVRVMPKIILQKQEYVRLVDAFTGFARVVVGPMLIIPEPSEDGPGGMNHSVQKAIIITSQTSVVLLNKTSGQKCEVRDQGMFTPGPYEDILEVRTAIVLKSQEYAVVQNELTGKYVHYAGPQQLFVGAYEQLDRVLPKIVLQKQEYVKLVDRRTGEETVVKGPQTIVPDPEQCEKSYTNNCLITIEKAIVLKADVAVLTLNKTSGVKQLVRADSGGIFTPSPYEEVLEVRQAVVLKEQEFAVVKDNMTGSYRHALGPQLLHVEAYEEVVRVTLKVVLARFEFLRLVNEQTGVERVVSGPAVLVPDPMEVSTMNETHSKLHYEMVQHAIMIDKDHGILAMNQLTGQKQLVTAEGMWIPAPYEHFVEMRPLIRVLANEAVIERNDDGTLTVYDGTAGGAGTNFFLQPRSKVVTMTWSVYDEPNADGVATVNRVVVDRIDMRIQRTFYSYSVRTNDNVNLMLMGTIFWRVANVTKMVLGTSDPSGDVWHHSRSSFMQALSNTTFDAFMGSFNTLAKAAYEREIGDGFYERRGVALLSMEVTRFEAVDDDTKATLRRINEETTNQITLLKKQQGENAVRSAKMRSDIALAEEQTVAELSLEKRKVELIHTRAENQLLVRKMDAEGDAQPFAQEAKSFIAALNGTGVSVSNGVDLYRTLKEAEHHNTDTKNLASGNAKLFLTSEDVKLNIRNLNLGSNSSSDDRYRDC